MVYNIDELVKRMAAGETPDSIAAEMTDMLNAASAQHQEVIRAEEEAKRAAQRAEDEKRQEVAEILLHIVDFLKRHYPGLAAEASKGLSEEEKDELFVVVLDAVLEALNETANPSKKSLFDFGMDPMTMMLMQSMMGGAKTPTPKKKPAVYQKPKSDDDILNDFLSKICH